VLAIEIGHLGARVIEQVPGGIHSDGDTATMQRINLWSRIASRVLMRIDESLYGNEQDIYDSARTIRWEDHFGVDASIRVDVTAIRSPLKSLEFATLRIKDAICDRFRDQTGRRPDVDTRLPDVRVSAFLTADQMTLYLDTSGEALFKRGYRGEGHEAPLRENLAAGILALAGWTPDEPLFDPMCGSGTFLVEAAMMACDIAPGARRRFGFERLLGHDARGWNALLDDAREARNDHPDLPISGSDRAWEAVNEALESLRRIGVGKAVRVRRADALDAQPPAAAGVLVTNPPYGQRIGTRDELAEFFPRLGDVLKQRFSGWRCYLLSDDMRLPGALRLRESKRTPLFNGAIECRLFEFRMVAGRLKAPPA